MYMIGKHILELTFLNKLDFFCTVKWFQVLLYQSLTSIICLHTVCSIWLIDRILSGATTLGQGGPGSNGNEGVLYISQIFKVGDSSSDGLMPYLGLLSYPSVETQLKHFTVPVNWDVNILGIWHHWYLYVNLN